MLWLRFCSVCKKSKAIQLFGDEMKCLSCLKRKEYDSRPEVKEKKRLYWHKPEIKFNTDIRIAKYKREAIRREKEYTLSDEFAKLMLTSQCYYCGYLDLNDKLNGIDRKDNDIGYLESNCVPCCEACNFGKGRKTESEFIQMCERVYIHQKNIGNYK